VDVFIKNMHKNQEKEYKIAVLIPCYNEAITVGKVIDDFRQQLPNAAIYVFDNNSTDNTIQVSREHGAIVIKEPRQGKGFVVESMFGQIVADIYVLVDGDDTYSSAHVHQLMEPVRDGRADMVVATRLGDYRDGCFPALHLLGNRAVRAAINWIFHATTTDIFSGYRVFNQRVVERIPVVSTGFELETELTLQSLYYQMKIVEIDAPYKQRPIGSTSKLRTFRDGARVLWQLFRLFRSFKPLTFFGGTGIILLVLGILAGIPPIYDYMVHRYVYHVPLAILASALIILSVNSIFLGVLLHALNWRFRELHNVLTRRRVRHQDND
jgi:glycosyltransferase involved in cell wall biosynthesis